MQKVEMLVITHYYKPIKPGDIIDVPDEIALRWELLGIAKRLNSDVTENNNDFELENMKIKELIQICKERNIKIDKEKFHELSADAKKQYLINLIKNN